MSAFATSGAPPPNAEDIPEFTLIPCEVLREFCKNVFKHFGISDDDAALAADVLATADVRGIDSHGVARLHAYFELLEAGMINPTPNVRVVRETPSTATVDGDNGLGLIVGPKANEIAMTKAEACGSGWVSVCNTNHYGIAGYYPIQALKRDLIGMSMTNTTPLVAACHGAQRMLGTNPIAVAFPALEEPPIVIDMATSVIAYGKVEEARRVGKQLAEGCCIDKHGAGTTDPATMMDGGALLTFGIDRARGQHKGYCMSSMVDIMCAVFSGANWGPFVPPFSLRGGVDAVGAKRVGKGIGHFFGAYRIDGFREPQEFKAEIDLWIRTFRESKAQPGEEVLIPGDPERIAEAKRSVEGVPVKRAVLVDLLDICAHTGVPLPLPDDVAASATATAATAAAAAYLQSKTQTQEQE